VAVYGQHDFGLVGIDQRDLVPQSQLEPPGAEREAS
jgi:hypothetical protein